MVIILAQTRDDISVSCHQLTKTYKKNIAVDSIDLQIPSGVICGFLGKNGAGKTSTINMLAGVLRPTSGSISIFGRNTRPRNLGYLPDDPIFYEHLTAYEYLDFCAAILGMNKIQRDDSVYSLLTRVGLADIELDISSFSKGMRQRLGIAAAIVGNPRLVLMDEPLSFLDPLGRREVADIIKSLTNIKSTVILSTHILPDVENICDYVVIIHEGKILLSDYLSNLMVRFAKNGAKVRFFVQSISDKFFDRVLSSGKLEIERISSLEFFVSSQKLDMQGISNAISYICYASDISFHEYTPHRPTMEYIFQKVTVG